MSEQDRPAPEKRPAKNGEKSLETEWERKARIARIFGDVLPESTSDDRDEAGARGPQSSDDWLKAQVPPHHGG